MHGCRITPPLGTAGESRNPTIFHFTVMFSPFFFKQSNTRIQSKNNGVGENTPTTPARGLPQTQRPRTQTEIRSRRRPSRGPHRLPRPPPPQRPHHSTYPARLGGLLSIALTPPAQTKGQTRIYGAPTCSRQTSRVIVLYE